jgi:cardiolipin synthase
VGRSPLLTLPNALSLSRFPLAVGFFLSDGTGARVALLGVASATDFLDGWLARRERHTTRWGALLDPVADKVFVLAAFLSFVRSGELSAGELLVLLSRDLATVTGFLVARITPKLERATFRARWPGKVVTALQLAALLVLLVAPGFLRPLLSAIAVASAVAIVDYTVTLWRARGA